MKISLLIKLLMDIEKEQGDLCVFVQSENGDTQVDEVNIGDSQCPPGIPYIIIRRAM